MNNINACCASLIRTGFGVLSMPPSMLRHRDVMIDQYARIPAATKSEYRFPSDTDGFLEFGSEYAGSESQPDLCERFCYWHRHATEREHRFRQSEFFSAAVAYEKEVSEMAQQLLDAIAMEFGSPVLPSIRSHSYLQLCVYA